MVIYIINQLYNEFNFSDKIYEEIVKVVIQEWADEFLVPTKEVLSLIEDISIINIKFGS